MQNPMDNAIYRSPRCCLVLQAPTGCLEIALHWQLRALPLGPFIPQNPRRLSPVISSLYVRCSLLPVCSHFARTLAPPFTHLAHITPPVHSQSRVRLPRHSSSPSSFTPPVADNDNNAIDDSDRSPCIKLSLLTWSLTSKLYMASVTEPVHVTNSLKEFSWLTSLVESLNVIKLWSTRHSLFLSFFSAPDFALHHSISCRCDQFVERQLQGVKGKDVAERSQTLLIHTS